MEEYNSFIIPNTSFISVKSNFQDKNILSEYRDTEGNFLMHKAVISVLDKLYALDLNKVIPELDYNSDYGVHIFNACKSIQTRKDKLCLPSTLKYNIDIYFYVDITHDMSYMFSTVFTFSRERPIVFDMSPRDVEWSTKNYVVMDELGRCWYEHWSRKN